MLIDLVFSNEPANIVSSLAVPLCFSDHDMIEVVQKINNIKSNPKTIKFRDYQNYDPERLCLQTLQMPLGHFSQQ